MERTHTALLADLCAIKAKAPVVLNLTNYVAMDLNANALLTIGASPIMAFAEEELSELIKLADSVVLNIGTLDAQLLSRCQFALNEARAQKKSVVLDPVGAGATTFRTRAARHFLDGVGVDILRGNASEIASIFELSSGTRGVDSTIDLSVLATDIQEMSKTLPYAISVSGKVDYIFFRGDALRVTLGSQLMTKVTAMGCTASAITAAFSAVNPNLMQAAYHAMIVMGLAGSVAEKTSAGPGSFRVEFLDALVKIEGHLT